MLRSEIIRGIGNILTALRESGLVAIVQAGIRRDTVDSNFGVKLLGAFRQYSHLARNFGETENRIIEILGLGVLDEPQIWFAGLQGEGGRAVLYDIYERTSNAGRQLESFAQLIEIEAVYKIQEQGHQAAGSNERAILTTIVIEDEGHFSTPDRLVNVLRSISYMYEAVSALQGVSPTSLSVVACDSGSDKAFDFLGLASVVAGVKEIILGLWDRIVFHRERRTSAWLDVVSKSLPVLDQISDMQSRGAFGPEQAELLRRKIVDGVSLFIESGIVIPEISDRTTFNPRQLLAPEPKLLMPASPEVQLDPPQEGGESSSLSAEERALLQRLLEREKNEPSGSGTES